MLAKLMNNEARVTLISSTGVQFLDFDLDVDLKRAREGEFIREKAGGDNAAWHRLEYDTEREIHYHPAKPETVLLQLLRGAGLAGLAAMPECRQWHNGWHVRPLLQYTRAEIEQYAKQHQLQWIEDPSNANTDFDRNYLRQNVIPVLKARWPATSKTVSRSARHLADLLPELQVQIEPALKQCLNSAGRLSVSQLKQLGKTQQRWVIRAWIQQNGYPMPQQVHLEEVEKGLLGANVKTSPEVRWSNCVLRYYRDELWLMHNQPSPPPQEPIHWPDVETLNLPAGCGRLVRQPTQQAGIPDRLWREGKIQIHWRTEGVELKSNLVYGVVKRRSGQWHSVCRVRHWLSQHHPGMTPLR